MEGVLEPFAPPQRGGCLHGSRLHIRGVEDLFTGAVFTTGALRDSSREPFAEPKHSGGLMSIILGW